MAEKSKIAWTTSTFNPWIGCTRVSTASTGGGGCDNCYAEQLDRTRFSKTLGGATKEHPIAHWGTGAPRYLTSKKLWDDVLKWNQKREIAMGLWASRRGPQPPVHRVFCASLADVFDNEVDPRWRERLWGLINATPYLEWLLLTKRIGNARHMLPGGWLAAPRGRPGGKRNVRLMISVVNQAEADRDVPKLLSLPFRNGISYEPALGPVDWTRLKFPSTVLDGFTRERMEGGTFNGFDRSESGDWKGIEWIIVGGESQQGKAPARPFDLAWGRSTIAQCKAACVPVFVKQLGSLVRDTGRRVLGVHTYRAATDPAEWPIELRVQEFPS